MKLVPAKCPNCGANIEVDALGTATQCNYCKSAILVDDAIQKLKVELEGSVEIKNLPTVENLMTNGERYYNNGEWKEAHEQYRKIIELEPNNYLAVLRNGICASLDTDYYQYSLNPLLNGLKESQKIICELHNKEIENKIIIECVNAIYLLEKYVIAFYRGPESSYSTLQDVEKKLVECLNSYIMVANCATDDEAKQVSLKHIIDLADYLIKGKKYSTKRRKRNGDYIVETTVPMRSFEKSLYKIRNESVAQYNKLVDEDNKLKIKKQPLIRLDSTDTRRTIYYIIAIILILYFLFK